MARQGIAFQRLVECLELISNRDENVKIASPKLLRDKVSGSLREFDVVLTYRLPLRDMVVAVECKDYGKRKIGQPHVEAFATKCRHCGVDKGVLVSSSGFSRGALEKAKHLDIDCRLVHEIEHFKNIFTDGFRFSTRVLKSVTFEIQAGTQSTEFEELGKTHRLMIVEAGQSKEIDSSNIEEFVNRIVNQFYEHREDAESTLAQLSSLVAEQVNFTIEVSDPESFRIINPDGLEIEITTLVIQASYSVQEAIHPFQYFAYQTPEGTGVLRSAATHEFETPNGKSRAFMTLSGDSVNISLITNSDW